MLQGCLLWAEMSSTERVLFVMQPLGIILTFYTTLLTFILNCFHELCIPQTCISQQHGGVKASSNASTLPVLSFEAHCDQMTLTY